jgi:RNA polymerase sigma-70 factor (ECF subfamily)
MAEFLIEKQFRDHYSFLCTAAFNVVEDEDVAKDIVQNFFLYCLDKQSELQIAVSFRNYAFRAVRNAALSYKKKAEKVDYDDEILHRAAAAMQYKSELENEEREEERNVVLWEIIGQMPEKRRRIFLLSNKEGLKYTEIATQLDISVNTVKTHIRLSYEFLRRECKFLIRMLVLIYIWIG